MTKRHIVFGFSLTGIFFSGNLQVVTLGKISNLICEKHSLVIATTSFKFSNTDSRKLVTI